MYRIRNDTEVFWAERQTSDGWQRVLFTYSRSYVDSWDLLIKRMRGK